MSPTDFLRDLRYTLRTLRRDAGFAAFAILITGLGIGASVTVFSVVHTLILRPLPFAEPGQLVWITNGNTSGLSGQTTQVGHMLDLRERTRTLSAIAGYFAFYGVGDNLLTGRGEPERLSGVPVSENFFDVLGVAPYLGRVFNAEETLWNGPKAVMLGHGLWLRRFHADPAIVGTTLILNDQPHTVVGVLPASFDFASVFAPGSHFDLYFPFPLSEETNRWGNTMAMIGRLKPGVAVDASRAEIRTLGEQITRENPRRNRFLGDVAPLTEHVSGRIRPAVWVLAGSVGMVLLIVCANLSNLLLARTAARQKEIAIRTALGAGRRRLAAQMLTEGIVLSSSGALLGVLLAVAGTRALASLEAISIPLLREVRTDGTALGFALAVAFVTGIVFGLAPALQARGAAVTNALKDATRGSTEGRRRTWVRNALVVSEVAFACVLLVGAGLLIRSLVRVLEVDMGFVASQAATIRVDPDSRYESREQRHYYLDEVLHRVNAIPGVESAGITDALPLGRNRTWGAPAKGVTYERGRFPTAFVRLVTEGYAPAMRIPLHAGRDISATDTATSEPVIVINETMARTLWPGEDPIGKYVLGACAKERRVVGVLGDVRHLALEQASGNEMYLPMRQCGERPSLDLVVRSGLPPAQLAGAVRAALQPIAANLPRNDFRTLQQIVDKSVSPRRFLVLLLGGFAAFALVLASLGIYALVSYSVSQRTQEIGIRMALGASARNVQARIIGQTLWLAVAGMAVGSAASWVLVRAASGLLYGVTPRDPGTFLGMVILLTVVALIAGYVPARRASRVDPMVALRAE
ncbi:MAG TPA: ABC transporter permease [Vicinamibacterales bacterium]|nr:ABC transporter permease [Vicinamibacterales bacterium]